MTVDPRRSVHTHPLADYVKPGMGATRLFAEPHSRWGRPCLCTNVALLGRAARREQVQRGLPVQRRNHGVNRGRSAL